MLTLLLSPALVPGGYDNWGKNVLFIEFGEEARSFFYSD